MRGCHLGDGRGRGASLRLVVEGNPNTGKSTLFNSLTGLRQHTGNWPGKTVDLAFGRARLNGKSVELVDLPGIYGLSGGSPEEELARDFLLTEPFDAVIDVVDATSLERNLNLLLQTFEITDRVVVALNLMDEAARKGIEVDPEALSASLGVPVVPICARSGENLSRLLEVALLVSRGEVRTDPLRLSFGAEVEEAISKVEEAMRRVAPSLERTRWLALCLLGGDGEFVGRLPPLRGL